MATLNTELDRQKGAAAEELEQERATCRQLKNAVNTLEVSTHSCSLWHVKSYRYCDCFEGFCEIVCQLDVRFTH